MGITTENKVSHLSEICDLYYIVSGGRKEGREE